MTAASPRPVAGGRVTGREPCCPVRGSRTAGSSCGRSASTWVSRCWTMRAWIAAPTRARSMIALKDVIEATVSSLFPAAPSPETLTQFTETVMELLDHVSIVEQYEAGRILGTRLHELPQQEHDSGYDPTQRVKADTVASENTTEG